MGHHFLIVRRSYFLALTAAGHRINQNKKLETVDVAPGNRACTG